jgi:hypothetical protein
MSVKKAKDSITIDVPRNLYNKRVQDFINYIEHLKIVSKSKASQKDIDKLLVEVKKGRGVYVKELLKRAKIEL